MANLTPFEDLDDDEQPESLTDTGTVRRVNSESMPSWRRAFGCLSLIGAAALTFGAALLLLTAPSTSDPLPPAATLLPATAAVVDDAPTAVPEIVAENPVQASVIAALPTLSPDQQAEFLKSPVQMVSSRGGEGETIRNIYNPFTIRGNLPRGSVETYTVETGDTIIAIAERYGLQPETIVWSNVRSIALALRPGQILNILPVDGVYYQALNDATIAEIAEQYRVEPYLIIDSPYNDLFGAQPDDVLPSGFWVVIPGAEGESINWNPLVERVDGEGGVSSIAFERGDPGSCGLVPNPGSSGGWTMPLTNYTWVRGFSNIHGGVDLAAPPGTPVMAALGGTVIFSGWNSFGYGDSVVLAHGPYTTLYGHLSGRNVGCGQTVAAGQIVGLVGSTGDSTGPHLHFEIRYNDVEMDPNYTFAF